METTVLTRQHVAKLVKESGNERFMDRMIVRLRAALSDTGVIPGRDGFVRGPGGTAILEWMPHHDPGRSITIKTVAYTPSNPTTYQLPTIIGSLTRYDDVTGRLLAVCDGILPTAIRTGAASAIASGLLARPDSRVLGLVGAGAQAVTQAHALSRVFPLEQILVYDLEPAHAGSFADRVDFLGLDVRVVGLAELEAASDIICTVTSVGVGEGPVLSGENLRPHVHINAICADLIGKRGAQGGAEVGVRDAGPRGAGTAGGGVPATGAADLGPDLMTLCADPQTAARHQDRVTVFDSTGFALEDHVALDVFLELADEAGIGDRVQVEHLPDDALNPYSFQ